jgi:hypothetical protein
MPLIDLATLTTDSVLLDTVVARPVRSCPRQMKIHSQYQLPVQVARLVHMDLLLTTTTPVALIVLLERTAIKPGFLCAKFARRGNTKKIKDKHCAKSAKLANTCLIQEVQPFFIVSNCNVKPALVLRVRYM